MYCLVQHKSSTAHFKHSKRKVNDLGRLIAGRGVDESILQLTVSPQTHMCRSPYQASADWDSCFTQVSPKKPASRILSMLALARDHVSLI